MTVFIKNSLVHHSALTRPKCRNGDTKKTAEQDANSFSSLGGVLLREKEPLNEGLLFPPSRKKCGHFIHVPVTQHSLPRKMVFLISHRPSWTEVSTLASWQWQQLPFMVRSPGAVTILGIYVILTTCSGKYYDYPYGKYEETEANESRSLAQDHPAS